MEDQCRSEVPAGSCMTSLAELSAYCTQAVHSAPIPSTAASAHHLLGSSCPLPGDSKVTILAFQLAHPSASHQCTCSTGLPAGGGGAAAAADGQRVGAGPAPDSPAAVRRRVESASGVELLLLLAGHLVTEHCASVSALLCSLLRSCDGRRRCCCHHTVLLPMLGRCCRGVSQFEEYCAEHNVDIPFESIR